MNRVELHEFVTIKYHTVRKEYALFLAGSEERVSPGCCVLSDLVSWMCNHTEKLSRLRMLKELVELRSDEMDNIISELRGREEEDLPPARMM